MKENKKQHKCCVCGHVEYQKGENPVTLCYDSYGEKDWYCEECVWKIAEEF